MTKPPQFYVGIDPGERWIGVASLLLRDDRITLDSVVMDRSERRDMAETVDQIIPPMLATIVVESYQQRPVGFQRFADGITLQLIGALEYAAKKKGHYWATERPGQAGFVEEVLGDWPQKWPHSSSDRWGHAVSAWRVIIQYLLRNDPGTIALIRDRGAIKLRHDNRKIGADWHAPTLTWRTS